MSYHEYWLRCVESEVPQLLALGQQLGLLDAELQPTEHARIWHVIGHIQVPTGETTVDPETGETIALTTPKVDPVSGEAYWHANLTTAFDLLEYAGSIADPVIAASVAERGRYFMPTSPANPVCVTAGVV